MVKNNAEAAVEIRNNNEARNAPTNWIHALFSFLANRGCIVWQNKDSTKLTYVAIKAGSISIARILSTVTEKI